MRRLSGSFFLVAITTTLALFSAMGVAQAATWQVSKLTDNDLAESNPVISGSNIAWRGWDGNDWEIFLYDGVSTTQITDNNVDDKHMTMSGDYLSWQADDGNDREIFLYDGTGITQLTDNDHDDHSPRVSDGNVAWMRDTTSGDEEIHFYDGSSSSMIFSGNLISNSHGPKISGSKVVWSAFPEYADPVIYMFDGTTTSQLSAYYRENLYPVIDGDNVAWIQDTVSAGTAEVIFHDGTTTTQLTFNDTDEMALRISGDKLSWSGYDCYTCYDEEIFYYDGTTTTQLTDNDYPDRWSAISGDKVAWIGETGDGYHDWEIFVYDGTTTTQLTDNDMNDTSQTIEGDTIVWLGYDGTDYDVFMAKYVTCALGDSNCDGSNLEDIQAAFTNFTGPGTTNWTTPRTRAEGDVHDDVLGATTNGTNDGDVDNLDIQTMFANFNPAPDAAGDVLGAAGDGDPAIPDLIYDAATGEVVIDWEGNTLISYVLKNSTNSFIPGNHSTILLGSFTTATSNELSESTSFAEPGVTTRSLGNVFPTGLDLAGLQDLLTVNSIVLTLGGPQVPFDLVNLISIPPVPEPSTYVMAVLALVGLGLIARRR